MRIQYHDIDHNHGSFYDASPQLVSNHGLIISDFNEIFLPFEMKSMSYRDPVHMAQFQSVVDNLDLFEIKQIDPFYTWCNRRSDAHAAWSLLDCVFGNHPVIDLLGQLQTRTIPTTTSDHCAVVLTFADSTVHRGRMGPKLLRTEMWWFKEAKCRELVSRT